MSECQNKAHMGEHACQNREQCWEPCGELGNSEAHAKRYEPKMAVPHGYEIHELPPDYSGQVWIEGQVAAITRARQAAQIENEKLKAQLARAGVELRSAVYKERVKATEIAQQRLIPAGYLLQWPAPGGGRDTLWSNSDASAKAIGCPVEPVFKLAKEEQKVAPTWDQNASVCKGAWELGTACGKCAKCLATQASIRVARAKETGDA